MCDLWARLFDDITWTVTCGRSTRKDSLMLQVCSLHQAETAAAQRIQELDSYLREVRSCGTRSAIVAVPGTFISINTHKEHAWQMLRN